MLDDNLRLKGGAAVMGNFGGQFTKVAFEGNGTYFGFQS